MIDVLRFNPHSLSIAVSRVHLSRLPHTSGPVRALLALCTELSLREGHFTRSDLTTSALRISALFPGERLKG